MPSVTLPESALLSREAHLALADARRLQAEINAVEVPIPLGADDVAAIRKRQAQAFYQTELYRSMRDRYGVTVAGREVGNVYTEVFAPLDGVPTRNARRALINLHGGGFEMGSRTASHLESVPIAALARTEVFAIDYRMAPEHSFPAACEDVAAVYRELLRTLPPTNIAIYGCSAGGLLAAQAIAWFEKERLPIPGAIGMFCAAGAYYGEGDSGYFFSATTGVERELVAVPQRHPYFKETSTNDPLAFPLRSKHILSRFPPSLLLTSTRDQALSSVSHMHCLLVEAGVDAALHVWEGVGHAFHCYPDLSQARQAYEVTVKFFDKHLGI